MNKFSPFICGLSGTSLNDNEVDFIKTFKPWGVILFARNCQNIKQIKSLTQSIKEITSDHFPILIDQEGGRVVRFQYHKKMKLYSASVFGDIYKINTSFAKEALSLQCEIISSELKDLGININTIPVLDLPQINESGVIGDRAFSSDKHMISELGKITIDSCASMGVLPVIKHIPGHGRADVDSHNNLPIIKSSIQELQETDFYPFIECNSALIAMTAHIIYTEIDNYFPITISKIGIKEIIRNHIKFNGLLMTDDLSMKALSGDIGELALQSINAGCNLVLHCNGELNEMVKIGESLSENIQQIEMDDRVNNVISTEVDYSIDESRFRLDQIVGELT